MKIPSKQVCPLCLRDDTVTPLGVKEGRWLFRCSNSRRHPKQPTYEWTSTDAAVLDDDSDPGVMEEFDLFSDLPHCLAAGEPFVEYGIVEFRYKALRPQTYRAIVDRYGHRALEVGRRYTASILLASACRLLASNEELELRWGEATGFWSYNEVVSYWALAPAASEQMLTWADFATSNGLDASTWTIES
jgi:hypothetical protein